MAPTDQNSSEPAQSEAVKMVNQTRVACDGGPLGHPRVYLELGAKGEVVCPYCSCRFVLTRGDTPAGSGDTA